MDPNDFETLEDEFDLFSVREYQIPIWERIRFSVFREINQKQGQGQAHTRSVDGLSDYIRGFYLWMKNFIQKNPFFAGKSDFLFFGHQRRKIEEDGYWWDIYCDPIHEQSNLDYVHMEMPHLLSHRRPAKTECLRYLELIQYTGTIQEKLRLRSPTLSDNTTTRMREIEVVIRDRFGVDVDLVSKVRSEIHIRNTTLPLYKRLLDRVDPKVAVVVVSYGKETFIEACKRKDIPVVELQHGVIYDSHFGYSYPDGKTKAMFPDYFLTFGEFWNENVQFPIPDDHVIPVGYPYLENRIDVYDDIESSEQLLFISQGAIGRELSQFALSVHENKRIEHEVVYKLHPGEYERWEQEYPWLAESDMRVIDKDEPPLYQLFAASSAQVGVGSTAVYEALCFDLETFVFDINGSDRLQPLIEDGTASSIRTVEDLITSLDSHSDSQFDREHFFKENAVKNVIGALDHICQVENN